MKRQYTLVMDEDEAIILSSALRLKREEFENAIRKQEAGESVLKAWADGAEACTKLLQRLGSFRGPGATNYDTLLLILLGGKYWDLYENNVSFHTGMQRLAAGLPHLVDSLAETAKGVDDRNRLLLERLLGVAGYQTFRLLYEGTFSPEDKLPH